MARKTYRCDGCGHEITQDEFLPPPECCGEPMQAKKPCGKPQAAEAGRLKDGDEACDDGTR